MHKWIIVQSPYSDCWSISLMYILHKHCTKLSKIRCKHTVVTSKPWWKCASNVGIHQPIDPRPHSTESQGAPPHVRCQRGSSHSSLCKSHGFSKGMLQSEAWSHIIFVGTGIWRGNKLMHQCDIKHFWKCHPKILQKIESSVGQLVYQGPLGSVG